MFSSKIDQNIRDNVMAMRKESFRKSANSLPESATDKNEVQYPVCIVLAALCKMKFIWTRHNVFLGMRLRIWRGFEVLERIMWTPTRLILRATVLHWSGTRIWQLDHGIKLSKAEELLLTTVIFMILLCNKLELELKH